MSFSKITLLRSVLLVLLALFPLHASSKKGEFTTATSTGTQDITTVGFQPKAILLWTGQATAAGISATQIICYGMSDGTTSRSGCGSSDDNVATTNTGRSYQAQAITIVSNGTPTTACQATLSSFLSNGFRLNWGSACASGFLVHYLAFGGAAITSVAVTEHTLSTGTGNQDYTTVGFQGDWGFFLVANRTTTGTNTAQALSIGTAVSATKRWTSCIEAIDGDTMTSIDTDAQQRALALCGFGPAAGGALGIEFDFVSWLSNGFRFNQITAPASAWLMASLVIKGAAGTNFDVGLQNRCTTGSCVDTISLSFTPDIVGLSTWNAAAATTNIATSSMSFGAADASSEGAVCGRGRDVLNTQSDRQHSSTKSMCGLTTANPPATAAEADVAPGSNQFTSTWTTNDGVAAEYGWFAIDLTESIGGTAIKDVIMRGIIAFPR